MTGMSVVLLDPRFPAMLPVEAVPLLGDDVCYTEEVPVRIRWVIADLGGHTLDNAEVVVTTDLDNEAVVERLDKGEELIKAPSLLVHLDPDRELEAASGHSGAGGADRAGGADSDDGDDADAAGVDYSGGGIVDGEIVGTDEHTAAVAGVRRTSRTEVPSSVTDEMEDAVAVMTRALRQGAWEQAQTHTSLLAYLREETEELAEVIAAAETEEEIDQQELCKELSDILLQVLFHAEIANRRGSFDIGHVAGAFVAKMRSRAPYLFEDVERPVGIDEQERLWAEGRVAEGKEPYKEVASAAPGEASGETAAAPVEAAVAGATGVTGTTGTTRATGTQPAQTPPTGWSALGAAEEVIALARENGLHDADIPTDIRFPMVGLELDTVGDADNRLFGAVEAFRRELEFRFGTDSESDSDGDSDDSASGTDDAGDNGADAAEDSADRWGA